MSCCSSKSSSGGGGGNGCALTLAAVAAGGAIAGIALAHLWQPATCRKGKKKASGGVCPFSGKKSSKFDAKGVHLKYWGGRGLMETGRMLLAIGGFFPQDGDYVDGRYTTDVATGVEDGPRKRAAYNDIKDTLASNLGRMPVCATPAGDVGQSAAINYYLATELGLMGAGALEGATIVSIQEHLKEMGQAYRKLVPYGKEPSAEANDQWFDGGAEDASPAPADMKNRDRFLKWYAGRIEAVVGGGGFAVGASISLADVLLFRAFGECLSDAQATDTVKPWSKEPFGSKARTDKVLAGTPKLRAIIAQVAANPGVARWLAERGVQGF